MECEAKLVCELEANVGECTHVLVQQWHLCDDLVLQHYRDTVDHTLSNISLANMFQTARCSDVAKRMIDKAYDFIVDCIKQAILTCIPHRSSTNACYNIPGWNTYVRAKHDKARDAFLTWKYSGSPRQGDVYDDMRRARAQFKLALRYCREHIEQMKADACASSVFDKDARKFWKTVHKMSNGKATGLVSSVNNVSGEQNIADMWQRHFKNLYNAGADTKFCDIFQARVAYE